MVTFRGTFSRRVRVILTRLRFTDKYLGLGSHFIRQSDEAEQEHAARDIQAIARGRQARKVVTEKLAGGSAPQPAHQPGPEASELQPEPEPQVQQQAEAKLQPESNKRKSPVDLEAEPVVVAEVAELEPEPEPQPQGDNAGYVHPEFGELGGAVVSKPDELPKVEISEEAQAFLH